MQAEWVINPLFQLVEIAGRDAAAFLQGQLTQDLRRLGAAASLPAAWCNPKGRVVCTARLLDQGSRIGLVLPAELAEAVVKRLSMYRLRARVEIASAEGSWQCRALAAPEDLAALAALDLLPDDRRNATRRVKGVVAVNVPGPARCVEVYGCIDAFQRLALDVRQGLAEKGWLKALIASGVPTIGSATTERYTPHMLNLDRLGAVSFDKGCYTGQEVVARTEHLGQVKRRLMHYRLDSGTAAAGDKFVFEERDAGEVINAADEELLAIVPVELHRRTLTVNGHPASPVF